MLVPMVYVYLVLTVVHSALGNDWMKRLQNLVKSIMTWSLKSILYVFTAYISITGVVSGTTDQAAVKAAKLTISGMVPVVGGILSDASEAVLVGASVVKNTTGISGIMVIIAITVLPFLQIGLQYLCLKLTAAICDVFSDKQISSLIENFSGAVGFLLGMTGAMCLMFLISLVCFLRGVG
jgi:stage III sporulation protein AE